MEGEPDADMERPARKPAARSGWVLAVSAVVTAGAFMGADADPARQVTDLERGTFMVSRISPFAMGAACAFGFLAVRRALGSPSRGARLEFELLLRTGWAVVGLSIASFGVLMWFPDWVGVAVAVQVAAVSLLFQVAPARPPG